MAWARAPAAGVPTWAAGSWFFMMTMTGRLASFASRLACEALSGCWAPPGLVEAGEAAAITVAWPTIKAGTAARASDARRARRGIFDSPLLLFHQLPGHPRCAGKSLQLVAGRPRSAHFA